jgi:hypothetical protein
MLRDSDNVTPETGQNGKRERKKAESKEQSERKTRRPSKDHPWHGPLKHRNHERPVRIRWKFSMRILPEVFAVFVFQ